MEPDYRSMKVQDIPDPALPSVPRAPSALRRMLRRMLRFVPALAVIHVAAGVAVGCELNRRHKAKAAADKEKWHADQAAAFEAVEHWKTRYPSMVECPQVMHGGPRFIYLICTVFPSDRSAPFMIHCNTSGCWRP